MNLVSFKLFFRKKFQGYCVGEICVVAAMQIFCQYVPCVTISYLEEIKNIDLERKLEEAFCDEKNMVTEGFFQNDIIFHTRFKIKKTIANYFIKTSMQMCKNTIQTCKPKCSTEKQIIKQS